MTKEYFCLCKNIRYKFSIIRTSSPPAKRSPRSTPRGATPCVSFLTCIKSRFLLLSLKFQISDSLLQGSCVGINHCHSTVLKNKQRKVLDSLSWRFKQRTLRKHPLLPNSFHCAHIEKIKCVPQAVSLQSSACFPP